MVDRLITRKLKNGMWECRDSAGNAALGKTKQLAENQYHLLYKISIPGNEFDITDYNVKGFRE